MTSHQFKTVTLYFHFIEALGLEQERAINIPFLVKRFVIKSLTTHTDQANAATLSPILSIRSDLYNNEILVHYPTMVQSYGSYINHEFYPSIPNVDGNYRFALLYNKTLEAGEPANIDTWVTMTIEFYG